MSSASDINCHQVSSIDKRDSEIADGVKNWVDKSIGYFDIAHLYRDLQVVDRRGRQAVSNELGRLVDRRKIRRKPNHNGVFRKILSDVEQMDLTKGSAGNVLPIHWIFDIEKLMRMYSKNIAVIAGSPDSGKTAYMLNFALNNSSIDKMETWYFSSEMGVDEFRSRIDLFEDTPLESWSKLHIIEKSSDFADVIDPDGINIIDYLEIVENFAEAAVPIKEIYDNLNKGMAFIALQKKRNTKFNTYEMAKGAEGTLEKARLYLSFDTGACKIIKAKNWVNPLANPNGMKFHFKLYNGCKFLLTSTEQE